MIANKRYRFWKVFWVLLGINVLMFLLGFMMASMIPESMEEVDVNDIFSWRNLVKQLLGFGFSVVFYYVLLNLYYRLIEQRKPAMDFIRVSVITVIVLAVYYTGLFQVQEVNEKLRER